MATPKDAPGSWSDGMLDTADMLGAAAALPEQLVEAVRRAESEPLLPGVASKAYDDIANVVVLGLGQDALIGDILAAVGAKSLPVPVVTVRGASPPHFVGPRTLAFAVAGETNAPETAWAAERVLARGARLVAIAPPGALAEIARRHTVPLHLLEPGTGTRDALGAVLVPVLIACEQLGFLPGAAQSLRTGAYRLARRRDSLLGPDGGVARRVARRIGRTFPVVHGDEGIGAVAARRWVAQVNMAAKIQAFAGSEPDRSAVDIAGFGQAGDVTRQLLTLVALRSDFEADGAAARFSLAEEYATEAVASVLEVRAEGADRLTQLLDLVLVGDFVAIHLALAEGLDPGPVPVNDDIARRVVNGR
jgi:glucose/mannose-6-phosphate isomerase